MLKKASLKDIAARVGVSTALVSSVMNRKSVRVTEEVANRIRQVAEELNYQPNEIARSLRKGLTKTLGLIVADISNPFFSSLARNIENEASNYGYTVIIGSSDEEVEKSETIVNTFLNKQVDGMIIAPAQGTNEQIFSLLQNKMPLVLIDRYFPELNTNYVILDNYRATYEATRYLIKRGFKRIGILAYKWQLRHMQDRISGYKEAMKSCELSDKIYVIETNPKKGERELDKTCVDLFGKNKTIDAMIFTTNLLSIEGLYCVIENKIRIPDDLGIIGFDGGSLFDLFSPPITYVKQPIEDMANEAVKILMDCLGNRESNKTSHIILKPKLIIQSSC